MLHMHGLLALWKNADTIHPVTLVLRAFASHSHSLCKDDGGDSAGSKHGMSRRSGGRSFLQYGVPFILLVSGGSYGLSVLLQGKYDVKVNTLHIDVSILPAKASRECSYLGDVCQ